MNDTAFCRTGAMQSQTALHNCRAGTQIEFEAHGMDSG